MGQQISFMKNLSIAGGMLVLAAFGPGALSLDARRARRLNVDGAPHPARELGACLLQCADGHRACGRLAVLPWLDWVALALFFPAWAGYAIFAKRRVGKQPSLLATTNRVRRQWMLQTTYREVRVVDGVVIQNLSTSPSFFASTTILIIGGLLAVLGTADKASELVRELPFAARTSALVFDLKLLLLLAIFVYAFFRFTWSMRQYTFGALLVAAAPEAKLFERANLSREAFADKAGRIVGMAAETFNDGLRALLLRLRRDRLVLLADRLHGRDRRRRLHPLPARVRLRRAGRAQLLSGPGATRPARVRRRAPGASR